MWENRCKIALSGVGFSLVARARELLARALDLGCHLPHFGGELVARLFHLGDARPIGRQFLVELAKIASQIRERGSLLC